MSIITVGIDLAKNVFAVHGVDDNGKAALVKPKVSREHLLPLIARSPPWVIGMEARVSCRLLLHVQAILLGTKFEYLFVWIL